MKSWRNNVAFVLVEPCEPGNIGASARAVKNMGFRRLELVNPPSFLNDAARSRACGAKDVLEQAMVQASFSRAGLTEWEFKMIQGICTQVEKKLKK